MQLRVSGLCQRSGKLREVFWLRSHTRAAEVLPWCGLACMQLDKVDLLVCGTRIEHAVYGTVGI